MSTFNTEVTPPSDKLVIKTFIDFALALKANPSLGLGKTTVTIGVTPNKEIDIETYFNSDEFKAISKDNVDVVEMIRVFLTGNAIYVTFNRNSSKPTSNLTLNGEGALLSDLSLNNLLYKIRKALKPIATTASSVLNQEFILSIQRDLGAATEYLKEDIYKVKRTYDEELTAERKQIKKQELIKEAEFLEKVKAKEEELRVRELEIERITNTDARRKIRLDLNKEIDKKIDDFGPSKTITKEYKGLNAIFQILLFLLAVASCLMLFVATSKLRLDTNNETMAVIGIELGSILFVTIGFFIYYSRWKSSWINKLLQEEFSLKKYRLDIDRSSWLLESYLEVQVSHQKEIPDSLILPMTSKLFENPVHDMTQSLHPIEEILTSLTKNSRIRVKNAKNEIELEKREKI